MNDVVFEDASRGAVGEVRTYKVYLVEEMYLYDVLEVTCLEPVQQDVSQ